MVFSELLLWLGQSVAKLIYSSGYFGVYVFMILESMVLPVPSELVMPLAGFLAYEGKFSFWLVCISGTIGTVTGSVISYYMGANGGNQFFIKYGKYFLIDLADLRRAEEWFKKKGEITILIGRLVPVVRHLISVVAGIAKADIGKVMVYSAIGGLMWNTFLAGAGYILGEHWSIVKNYTEPVSIAVVLIVLAIGLIFAVHRIKDKMRRKETVMALAREKL